jgi:hypothetical protein
LRFLVGLDVERMVGIVEDPLVIVGEELLFL